jgi:hypothetical protein
VFGFRTVNGAGAKYLLSPGARTTNENTSRAAFIWLGLATSGLLDVNIGSV